jgi:hypothetical protein
VVLDDVPLADALVAAGGAQALLLLGDGRRLGRRVRGTHPPGAAVSALEYLAGGRPAPGDGVLLDTAARTHPAITRLVGQLTAGGRVTAAPGCERLGVESAGVLHGGGLRWVPAAAEEAAATVAELVRGLLADGRWTDRHGTVRPLRPRDVLVLVPFERQVRGLRASIRSATPPGVDAAGVRVGTVDGLRDDEAPVVLCDLAGAGPPDGWRGAAPVPSRERLGEMLSRAGALAAVVADPALLLAPAADLRQLEGLDALHRLVAEADHVRGATSRRYGRLHGHHQSVAPA